MKKILFTYLLLWISLPAFSENKEAIKTIKDISFELASINQQIATLSQESNKPTNKIKAQAKVTKSGMIQIQVPLSAIKSTTLGQSAYLYGNFENKEEMSFHIFKYQTKDVYELIIYKMRALKLKYENNPYIRITGFSINIGIPPSVTVAMEFKK